MTLTRYATVARTVRGDRVKKLRENRDMTQAQLAVDSGVAQSYLSEIERGSTPSVGSDALVAIAKALETSVDYIVGLSDDPRSPTRKPVGELTAEEEKLIKDFRRVQNEEAKRIILDVVRAAVREGV